MADDATPSPNARRGFPLRLPVDVFQRLRRAATRDRRSVNEQIVHYVETCLPVDEPVKGAA
jgi:hypothetical protein